MSLESKIRLIIGVTLFGLLVVLYGASKILLLERFDTLEGQYVWEQLKQAEAAYNNQLDRMDRQARDLAESEEPIRLLALLPEGPPSPRPLSFLSEVALQKMEVQLAVLLNRDGGIVARRTLFENTASSEGEPGRPRRLEAEIEKYLGSAGPLVRQGGGAGVKGMIMLGDGPFLTAVRPVPARDDSATSLGLLLVGKYLDRTMLAEWSNDHAGRIDAIPVRRLLDSREAGENIYDKQDRKALARLLSQKGFVSNPVFEPHSDTRMAAYFLVKALPAETVVSLLDSADLVSDKQERAFYDSLLFRVELPRDIHRQKKLTEIMLIVSLVSAGLFFGLSVHYLIQYEFVSRLALLDKSLSEISISQDMSRRVRVRGKDEMAHLGDSINRMLESLERYQADLAMSRETAQALMNASIDTAFLVDLEGRILENNRPPQGLLLGGDQPEDRPIVDRHFDEVLEPEWADFLKGCVGIVAQQDEGLRFEKEDANRILDFSMYPVFNTGGKCNSVAIFIRDITRRRRAEDSLKERERQYREIVEYANSIILRWGMDGNIRYINDFGLRFFGFKPDELIGKPIVGTLVADDARSGGGLRHIMDDIREHPELYIWHENENRRWNGEKVFVAWGNKPILDEDGNIVEILSMGIDVTESKRRGGKGAPAE